MATNSSTLAWKIPWTEEPGRLQSMVSLRVGYNWTSSLSLFTFMHWRRKWQPTPVFLPGESQGWGNLGGCRLWGHTESDTTEATSSSSSSNLPVIAEKKKKKNSECSSLILLSDCLLMILMLLSHFQNMSQIWSFPTRLTPPQIFFLAHWNSLLPRLSTFILTSRKLFYCRSSYNPL